MNIYFMMDRQEQERLYIQMNCVFILQTKKVFLQLQPTHHMSETIPSTPEDERNKTDVTTVPDFPPTTSIGFTPRYVGPSNDEMTPEQGRIRDEIVATRKRTGLSGPFGPWLAIPAIADPAQRLGRACRYETSLSFQESELVILLTGAKLKSHTEFDIHVGEALKSGWKYDTIAAIPRDNHFSIDAVKEKLLPKLENDRQKAIAISSSENSKLNFTNIAKRYTVPMYDNSTYYSPNI
jgi:hypothetical protein